MSLVPESAGIVPRHAPSGRRVRSVRGGFALSSVALLLVVVAVVAASGLILAREGSRRGVTSPESALAFYVAETGLATTLEAWPPVGVGSMAILTDTVVVAGSTGAGDWQVDVVRTGERMYFLHSTGLISARPGEHAAAAREVGLAGRVTTPGLRPAAAVTTAESSASTDASANIDGADVSPPGWSGELCPGPPLAVPGLLVEAVPSWLDDPAWTTWVEMADHSIPAEGTAPTAGAGRCDPSNPWHWGTPEDPPGPCGHHFPVVHFDGDTSLSGELTGQGVLLVDGDLTVDGSFRYAGVVVVRGRFEATGAVHVRGAVVAGVMGALGPDTQIGYSSCALDRALLEGSASRFRPLGRRALVDLGSSDGG